ncbi:hypothetical protein SISNIDRAFT_389013, partial [Sistotremastrum niveocremeum HHB9708]
SSALLATSVRALTITTPTNWAGNQTNTVKWTSVAGDPSTFSIELIRSTFHEMFSLANNVDLSDGSLDIPLPQLTAGPGFTLEFVNVSNVTQVFATSGTFTI